MCHHLTGFTTSPFGAFPVFNLPGTTKLKKMEKEGVHTLRGRTKLSHFHTTSEAANLIIERIGQSKQTSAGNTSYTLSEERKLFENSFLASYKPIPECESAIGDILKLKRFISDAFDEEEMAFRTALTKGKDCSLFYRARVHDNIVGYLSMDFSENNSHVYFRQLAVHPMYQRFGLARSLIQYVFVHHPTIVNATVSTRSWNLPAIRFYEALGFQQSKACDGSLDAKQYIGFVWSRQTPSSASDIIDEGHSVSV